MAEKNKMTNPVTKNYEPSDYQNESEVSSGLATTHEQVSDAYVDGTIDAQIDDLNDNDAKIPRTGFDEDK